MASFEATRDNCDEAHTLAIEVKIIFPAAVRTGCEENDRSFGGRWNFSLRSFRCDPHAD